MASLTITAGLLGILMLSLASRDGLSDQNRNAALHAFEVAATAEAPNRAMPKPAPARATQSPPAPSKNGAKIVSEQPPSTIDFETNLFFDAPVASSQDTPAPNAKGSWRNAPSPMAANPQPVEASALPASAPRGETNAYSALVLAWLKRHQHFPEGQVRDALDATVLIAFTIDRRGRAGDVRVLRGSGIAWLDALALRQVRSASPFPRPRQAAPADALSFEVPMRYRARG